MPRKFYVSLSVILLIVLAACGGGEQAPQDTPSTTTTTDTEGRLLVWLGEGASPTERTPRSTGQVAYLNSDGTTAPLLELSAETIAVTPCGTSNDGRYFAFFVNTPSGGEDSGILYQITGTGEPAEVGTIQALTCVGNGTLHYNSGRLAFIDYRPLATRDEYALGTLRVLDAASLDAQTEIENVTAFSLGEDSAAYVRFFPNARANVDEAAVSVWMSGQDNPEEIATLFPDADCRFTSAQIAPINADGVYAVVMGQRCPGDNRTQWQYYRVSAETATLALNDAQPTGFLPYTRTNTILRATDGTSVFHTLPDGLTANTVSVVRINAEDSTPELVVERGAVMPRYDARTFTFPVSASPMVSRDGRWWAMVVVDNLNLPTLTVIDLNNPTVAPIRAAVSGRTDNIPFMAFTPDNSAIYYLAGGVGGVSNTLFRLNLADEAAEQLARGQFGAGVVAPSGDALALLSWQRAEDTRQTPYTNLIRLSATDPENPTTLFTGVELAEDGSVSARRFAYPLAWR